MVSSGCIQAASFKASDFCLDDLVKLRLLSQGKPFSSFGCKFEGTAKKVGAMPERDSPQLRGVKADRDG